ncbi:metal-dependent transcriptional regulator [Methanimicrococcus blatticola]|uniref:DtxR family iron (Metal) dependent repressor n=1 Tax=Methanimicrococcus blatticola TaxID=91560 RepID=A0A484F6N8_9EURY|nr:metal-dependent transcriptional regulator [Methanimicrococcus blatticola]MBZ3935459.1 metal-dependent transcriptional regulator [Methanimicrococcus blatticola]MCC2509103.1 metal-dependent transcriptional regulator [Methanimicrococcus blatticola]TDQ69528.1 DtxR family iron (metal) dependent repressor [Methanimicrococcus blatticola]
MTENKSKNVEISGLELSPRKVSYLKFLLTKGETVRTTEISEAFDVDPSTVTKLIAELADDGYLDHIPYRGVTLTEAGKVYAEFCLKRHQILGLMFSHYGLTPDESCDETSRIETFVSKKAVDRMCSSMGHPTISCCVKPGEARQINHDSCFHESRPNLIKKL